MISGIFSVCQQHTVMWSLLIKFIIILIYFLLCCFNFFATPSLQSLRTSKFYTNLCVSDIINKCLLFHTFSGRLCNGGGPRVLGGECRVSVHRVGSRQNLGNRTQTYEASTQKGITHYPTPPPSFLPNIVLHFVSICQICGNLLGPREIDGKREQKQMWGIRLDIYIRRKSAQKSARARLCGGNLM